MGDEDRGQDGHGSEARTRTWNLSVTSAACSHYTSSAQCVPTICAASACVQRYSRPHAGTAAAQTRATTSSLVQGRLQVSQRGSQEDNPRRVDSMIEDIDQEQQAPSHHRGQLTNNDGQQHRHRNRLRPSSSLLRRDGFLAHCGTLSPRSTRSITTSCSTHASTNAERQSCSGCIALHFQKREPGPFDGANRLEPTPAVAADRALVVAGHIKDEPRELEHTIRMPAEYGQRLSAEALRRVGGVQVRPQPGRLSGDVTERDSANQPLLCDEVHRERHPLTGRRFNQTPMWRKLGLRPLGDR